MNGTHAVSKRAWCIALCGASRDGFTAVPRRAIHRARPTTAPQPFMTIGLAPRGAPRKLCFGGNATRSDVAREAAADLDRRAGHVAVALGDEERRDVTDLLGLRPAAEQRLIRDARAEIGRASGRG